MLYTSKQFYTPPLHAHEFNERALIIDTETVGAGPQIEIIEIALGDTRGEIIFDTLVRPTFNPLPTPSKHKRFSREEFETAPHWPDVWQQLAPLIEGKLLIAYNAAFDRRALAATCARFRQRSEERGWRCALQLVKQALGIKKSLTLTDACARYGVEGGNHRAARDVLAVYVLLRAVLAAAPQE
jgi:DNA polymerase-3 subunit epsilon